MYLTQDEFSRFGGELEDDSIYPRLEHCARAAIDSMTGGRLKDVQTVPESVKWAVYDCIQILASAAGSTYDVLPASVSNDGVSISYARSDSGQATEVGLKMLSAIRSYLMNEVVNGVPLLYAGVT